MSTQAVPLASLDARSGEERRSRRIAILLMCVTMACYTATDSSAKFLAPHLPLWQIVWARYLGATLFALCLANPIKHPNMLRPERLGLQLVRSLFLLTSTILSFIAVRYLQLAETTAIFFALPLAIALAAGPILGEWVGPRRFAAILVGFTGVLVVVRPWTGTFHPAMGLCVANVIVSAGYNMLTRVVAQRDRALTTLIYSTLVGAILLTPIVLTHWVAPDSLQVTAVMVFIGVVGAFAHWLLILAHARAPASILAPFTYTQLIWASLSGLVVFGDVPKPSTLAGAGIVVLAGLYLWWRERGT
ncbi:DMT family transporter [Lichenifustis flavocetrariae]|uniref:DMT family transporter n=1 Tax=Lichenifustis flavocetrariae TaxID=2949735 RepID=A0AA41YZW6_9HYPH|nr:DMT family transporter [Lichenifustis flavocetrariae]MCW6511639.1 DMT family transporter [Lichenifustis flavocetrariae]